ncbi:MAG: FAD binding domain-containing protein, partial [Woeseia sp.]
NSDPAADYPAAVLALNAIIVTDRREINADDFFVEMFETALQPDEIVVAVRFQVPKCAAYLKFPSPASRYAVVGVMVAKYDESVRVAVTGAAGYAFRSPDMEQALSENFVPAALESIELDSSIFNSDIHASAEYRAHLVKVMAGRAVAISVTD